MQPPRALQPCGTSIIGHLCQCFCPRSRLVATALLDKHHSHKRGSPFGGLRVVLAVGSLFVAGASGLCPEELLAAGSLCVAGASSVLLE